MYDFETYKPPRDPLNTFLWFVIAACVALCIVLIAAAVQ